jgi:Tfp pilus assembly protein PilO
VTLSAREKMLVAISALVALGYAGTVYVLDPLLESQQTVREEIVRQRTELESLRMLASERGRYQRRVESLRGLVAEAESVLLNENKIPVVAAEVQEWIHRFGQETGVSIVREAVLPQKTHEQFVEIPVELSVKGSLRDIHAFLYKVEMNERLLTVPRFAIRSPVASTGPLSVDLHIAGHMVSRGKL